ncbi:thiamine-monophosphate kinase [Methanofollis liminatans DSM 4140]|uniref:Thiamine-monophosphate kinase n=1 Tax=Methanofollis liminatans DSM 4140 TaxID=28892 RepID=J1L5G0_9EURY|nr:thiamine-phosphate kinase [Methanofollis liminatans]EJG08030.1 thiamine-monophosphate kinase [Methanofollis liminatans DSM 4140]
MDERSLIRSLVPVLGAAATADDCATIQHGGEWLVLSTDMLHETTDFPAGMTDREIGWMAAAVTISDIAAMGARPVALLLATGLDRPERLAGITAGALECCRAYGCDLAGGDTDAHTELTIVSTGLGTALRPVRRSGAGIGDLICVTGYLGGAQAALSGYDQFWERLIAPEPRVAAGLALNAGGATAMMDVSDGLAMSLHDMLGVNDCGFTVETVRLPIPDGVPAEEGRDFALFGGGDFELLFTVPPERFPVAGVEATAIGRVVAEHGVWADGASLPARGYVHTWTK